MPPKLRILPRPRDRLSKVTDAVALHVLLPYLDVEAATNLGRTNRHWREILKTYILSVFPRHEFDEDCQKLNASSIRWYWAMRLAKYPQERCAKSTAMTLFRVTATKCYQLPHVLTRNPIFRSAAPMMLFSLRDVFQESMRRFKSIEALRSYKDRLSCMKANRRATRNRVRRRAEEEAEMMFLMWQEENGEFDEDE